MNRTRTRKRRKPKPNSWLAKRKWRKERAQKKKKTSSGKGSRRKDKLYRLERVSNKSWYARWFGLYEIKFGVTSRTVNERHLEVDEAVEGEVIVSDWLYLPGEYGAEYWEQRLLDKYKDKAWSPGGGKGAGNTEWLRIGWATYVCILIDFWYIRNYNRIWLTVSLGIILLFAVFYFLTNSPLIRV